MFTRLDFLQFKYFGFYLCSLYFKIPVPENAMNFFLITAIFVVAATNLGVLVSTLVPDALKATQILMVIASPAFLLSVDLLGQIMRCQISLLISLKLFL